MKNITIILYSSFFSFFCYSQDSTKIESPIEDIFSTEYKINVPVLPEVYYNDNIHGDRFSSKLAYNSSDGSIRKINKTILETMKTKKKELIKIASYFPGVEPTTIAACILAENTMNVQRTDRAQEWLRRNSETMFSIAATVFGKSANTVSLGLGQINIKAAIPAEPYVAKIEGRTKHYNESKLGDIIQDSPRRSMIYAAGILQDAIDRYQEFGFDIRSRPDLQCTLYNIGQPKARAKRALKEARQPELNYFGFFVNKYYNEIRDTIGLKDNEKIELTSKYINFSETEPAFANRKSTLNTNINAYNRPGTECSDHINSTNTADLYRSKKISGSYKTLSFQIGCDLKSWSYIETEKGDLLWAPTYKLQINSSHIQLTSEEAVKRSIDKIYCSEPASSNTSLMSCIADIRKTGLYTYDTNNKSVRLTGDKVRVQSLQHEYFPKNKFSKLKSYVENKKKNLLDFGFIDDLIYNNWDSKLNPWNDLFTWVDELESCFKVSESCSVSSEIQVKDLLYFTQADGLMSIAGIARERRRILRETKVFKNINNTILLKTPLSNSERKDLLHHIEHTKRYLMSSISTHGKEVTVWSDTNNPYRDLFLWVDDLKNTQNPILSNNMDYAKLEKIIQSLFTLTNITKEILEEIKDIKVSNYDVKEDISKLISHEKKPIKKVFLNTLLSCSSLDQSNLQYLTRLYNKMNNIDSQDLFKSEAGNAISSLIKQIGNNCKTIESCKDKNKPSVAWSSCSFIENDFDTSFLCQYTTKTLETELKKQLYAVDCLANTGGRCPIEKIEEAEMLDKLANLDCVGQIVIPDKSQMDRVFSENYSEQLKSKAVFYPYSEKKFLTVLFSTKCKAPEKGL